MRRIALIFASVAVMGLLLACADNGNDNDEATPGAGDMERADADVEPEDSDALAYVLDSVGGAPDMDRLRGFMTPELRDGVTLSQQTHAVICFPTDVVADLRGTELEHSDDRAALLEHWIVTAAGAGEHEGDVVRRWEFERRDNDWFISGLPDCPYDPADDSVDPDRELDDDPIIEDHRDGDELNGDEDDDD